MSGVLSFLCDHYFYDCLGLKRLYILVFFGASWYWNPNSNYSSLEMSACSQGKGIQAMPGKDVKTIKKDIKAMSSEVLKNKNRPKKFKKGGGVIYLGRIPHGFYEDQMTGYFNQFGRVVSAVVPRSKKSGRSKGYGFVEFEDEEVAKIAAETMNNYLMYNKIIKCRYIPPEERKKPRFRNRIFVSSCPRVLNRIENANKKRESLSKLNLSAYQKKTQEKISEFKQFFEERGIDFNFKVDVSNSKDVNYSNNSEKDETKDSNNGDDEIEDQFGVLEIDASDAEIHFKIPPQVKKVIKKSKSSMIAPNDNSQMGKKLRVKRPKKSGSKEVEQIMKPKEVIKRVTNKLEEKNKVKEKTSKKVFKTEKSRPLRKRNQALVNQKKLRMKQVDNASISKKEKSNRQQKSLKLNCKKISSLVLSENPSKKKIKSVTISYFQI